jgi:hypothetical protein
MSHRCGDNAARGPPDGVEMFFAGRPGLERLRTEGNDRLPAHPAAEGAAQNEQ